MHFDTNDIMLLNNGRNSGRYRMAKKNFYAVKIGKTTGIFTTWSECEASVHGYPGAKYRGFATLEEAKQYLGETERRQVENELTAYVDGSFEVSTGVYSFGCVFLLPKKEAVGLSKNEKEDATCKSEKEDCMICASGSGNDKELAAIRNVAGEMLGAMYAVKTARKNGYKSILICYDYLGIEMWATGKWKTNNVYTKKYAAYMKEQNRYLQISFQKIAAHTGEKWNEEADRLAKEALCAPVGMPETLLWRDNASSENNASI